MYGLQGCFKDDCTICGCLAADCAVLVQVEEYACRYCKDPADTRFIMVSKAIARQLLLVMDACPYDDLAPASLPQMGVRPSNSLWQCA